MTAKPRFYILIEKKTDSDIFTCKFAEKPDVVGCIFTEYIDDPDYSIVIGSPFPIEKTDMFYAGALVGAELAEKD
jgi:hypothetical protein